MIQFSINSKELRSKLEVSGKFISKNPVVPVLENFWFVIKDKVLSITGGDGQNFITSHLPIECERDIELCVPADKLTSLLAKLPSQELKFSYNSTIGDKKAFPPEPDTFALYMQHVSGEYELMCEDPTFYIRPKELKEPMVFSIEREFIKHCADASKICPTETYVKFPYLLIRIKNKILSVVGCDAANMLQITKEFDSEIELDLYFQPKTIQALHSILEDDVTMEYNKSHVVFKNKEVNVTCRLMDDGSKYPDFETMLSGYIDNVTHKVVVDPSFLIPSLERLNMYAAITKSYQAAELCISKENITVSTTESVNNTTGSEIVPLEDYLGPSEDSITYGMPLNVFASILKGFCNKKAPIVLSISRNCTLLQDFDSEGEYKRICLSMGLALESK